MRVTIFCKDGSIQVIHPSKATPDVITREYAESIVGSGNFWKMQITQA